MTAPRATMSPQHRRTLLWVVGLGAAGLAFDAYDLVVYGGIVPILLRDPGQIGMVSPQLAGAMGSYTLFGVLLGALFAGAVADRVGRRRVVLASYLWFSVGMAATATADSTTLFGFSRFATGIGIGAILATAVAVVNEFAPPSRKNFYVGITYAGNAAGAVIAGLLTVALIDTVGWRGMLLIGALPLVTLLPLAWFRLPESPEWLAARGRVEEARAVSARTGVPLAEPTGNPPPAAAGAAPVGYRGLLRPGLVRPALLMALVGTAAQILVFSLNTWLPELLLQHGFSMGGARASLVAFNLGAVLGAVTGARVADRIGPRTVVAGSFVVIALTTALLAVDLPIVLLLVLLVVTGTAAGGAVVVFAYAASYFVTAVRAAAVSWVTGFSRVGGIIGPAAGGLLIGAGLALGSIFLVVAAAAAVGCVLTLLIPAGRGADEPGPTALPAVVEPAPPAATVRP